MDVKSAYEHLAKACIQILQYHWESLGKKALFEERRNALGEVLNRNAFIRYAIENWNQHIRATKDPSDELIQLVLNLLASPLNPNGLMNLEYYVNHGGSLFGYDRCPGIHLAAYFNLPWIMKIYISESPNDIISNLRCGNNDTPLMWAAEIGSTECVELLLKSGGDPNAVEYDDWSALHWAANNGHVEIAKLLIEFSASLDHRENSGLTARDWAIKMNQWDVVNLIDSRGNFTNTIASPL